MSTVLGGTRTWPPWTTGKSSGFNAHLLGRLWRRVAGLHSRWRARRAEAELLALDDRILKDIGLTRSEIRSALTDAGERRRGAQDLARTATARRSHRA